jgi:phospholipase A1
MTQTRRGFAVLLFLGAALAPATSGADDGLSRCAKLESADERLACYDELARATASPSGGPVDASPRPSHLTDAWKLDAKNRGVRHLTDILEYRPNYIIARWTNNPNIRPSSPAPGHAAVEHIGRGEVKIQGSFKTELVSRQAFEQAGITQALGHLGFDSARLWFGYTQMMNWQAFNNSESRPIRESNYEPEAILTLGTGNQGNGFKLLNLGLTHESNGLQQSEHRGWNRAYAQGGWEWGQLSVLARVWRRIPEAGDDNPDINAYLGRGDLVTRYQAAGGYVTSVLLRRNLQAGRGFVQIDCATPLLKSLGAMRIHVQVTSGHGETLIDYNHEQTTIGIGVSFGDW